MRAIICTSANFPLLFDMKKLLLLLLLSFAPSAMSDGIPDLGDVSQASLSPLQERQIGLQTMLQIRASKQYLDDPEINDYLNQIGAKLVEKSTERSQAFEFFCINDSSVNAFAVPGGFVGVNMGLLLITQSESELASVLGHEIAHVTQHHYARLLNGTQGDGLAVMAAMAVAILAARSNPQAAQATVATAQATAIQKQLDFTRTHEQEADRIGLDILQKSGFSVHAMPEFLERMQHANRLLEGNAPNYLRTHPITSNRIADVGNRVEKYPYQLIPDSIEFQLVRTKLIASQKTPNDSLRYFNDALTGTQKFGNPLAQRYGLILSLLRVHNVELAAHELATLRADLKNNPMVETLAGQVLRAGKNIPATLAFYQTALRNFPQYRALVYDYADVLLQNNQAETSVRLVAEQITRYPSDVKLYNLQARGYAQLGKLLEQHQAQAYAFYGQGNLRAAMQQLELARESGGNFQQLSVIESDLRELRDMLAAQPKK
jgi:predicted Zn-dependent protease